LILILILIIYTIVRNVKQLQMHSRYRRVHWRRLVKNIGWANQNIGGRRR